MCGLGGPHSEGWPVGMWEMECTHFNKQVFFSSRSYLLVSSVLCFRLNVFSILRFLE